VETADYTDPVTGAEGQEITFKDEDGNDVGSVIVYHGVDGEDGQDGATPEIIDGNWWIDGTDTGIAATGPAGADGADGTDGQDGATPEIIDGNWWIDGTDTGIAATGPA